MKKSVILIIIFIILICPYTYAELGSLGLIVEGGKEELIMEKGEKEWLLIQNGFTRLPVFKGLTFFSDNTVVATVGLHTGQVTANHYGTANISVTDEAGENGIIQIKVVSGKENLSIIGAAFVLFALGCFVYMVLILKR